MEKKGVSSIVATVSLILLTFSAVVIIASFVIPFVRDNLSGGSECFPYRDYFSFEDEFGYNCYNTTGTRSYWISVRAGSADDDVESKVSGMRLSFVKSGDTTVIDIDDSRVGSLNPRMVSGGLIAVPKSGEVRSYIYENAEVFESVEIFTKLKSGKICDRSDSVKLDDVCR